jgi:hypothetical protein
MISATPEVCGETQCEPAVRGRQRGEPQRVTVRRSRCCRYRPSDVSRTVAGLGRGHTLLPRRAVRVLRHVQAEGATGAHRECQKFYRATVVFV